MCEKIYSLDCGNLVIRYKFLYPETHRYFGNYLKETSDFLLPDICLSPEYLEENRWLVDQNEESSDFLEFQSLMIATGNFLLEYNRALFHGVALLWKERAWIITAPSGIGKTTQLKLWKKILKRDIKIINGDKPILECRNDETMWVYSSPWRGKEKYGLRDLCAPLGGIILLEQSKENQIVRITPKEAVLPLFVEFVSYPENTNQIRHQGFILNQIVNSIPIWKLTNVGDENSANLTLSTIENYLLTEL